MNRREFQFSEGGSNKFWSIELKEQSFIVHYGRAGTHGQSQEKTFSAAEAARKEHDKLVAEKTKKGYTEVNVGDASQPRPVAVVKMARERVTAKEYLILPVSSALDVALSSDVYSASAPAPDSMEVVEVSDAAAKISLSRELSLNKEDRRLVTWEEYEPEEGRPLAGSLINQLAIWDHPSKSREHVRELDYGNNLHSNYLRFMTREEKDTLRNHLAGQVPPFLPTTPYESWQSKYYTAAALGMPAEVTAIVANIPANHYKGDPWIDLYQQPQWLVFGLPSRELVISEFKRLSLRLRSEEQVRAWLALTEYDGLDVVADSVCRESNKEIANSLASLLDLVIAPEAAAAALRIFQKSKVPQAGLRYLEKHPLHSAVGLVPVAMTSGELAEVAREFLTGMRFDERTAILTEALTYLPPIQSEWLQREIIDCKDGIVAELPSESLPAALAEAFAQIKAAKPPAWLRLAILPPIKIDGKRLGRKEVELVLAVLKGLPLGAPSEPILLHLKRHADAASLDSFAWKLFEQWLAMGAVAKDKWAMGAIGHLGGDASVLKLTPMIRDWPGESQHQRAVFGLEVLRAVSTDTALMSLNGIAQKLKFKGLREKAQAMMENIAQARGFTREQLADRIVPDCGLDEHGTRVFDFGPRQFKFVLGPEMKPLVRDAAGKLKPDLPGPNNRDDRELAEASVVSWKLLKKTLKEALKVQAERLEDAMITGRRWTPDEFETLIVKHPLMVNLARQLVFGNYDEHGAITQSFRLTEDQSLANADDDPCELPRTGGIGVVHPAQLDDTAKSNWGQVLSDYEIIPPFQQLGREICRPEPADLELDQIVRFKGPKMPGIVVYGILERCHWSRDTPADGGGFMQHSKFFPSCNVTSFIQYTGMSIGYYEEPQEIESVYFVPGHAKPDWWGDHKNKLKIKDVPPVVISEVLRLVHAIVAKAA